MRRWIFGVLVTFGVTAAIAVPLLTGSGTAPPRGTFGNGDARFVSCQGIAYDSCLARAAKLAHKHGNSR